MPELTSDQWHALPAGEKKRLRALKHAWRAVKAQVENAEAIRSAADIATSPAGQPGSAGPLAYQIVGTPFRDPKTGRELPLVNAFFGASCFVILTGPSALQHDLSMLRRRGIFTFGVNNSPAIVRPNAWTCVDPVEKFHSAIWLDPHVAKFVNSRRLDSHLRKKESGKEGSKFLPLKLNNGKTATPKDMPNVISTIRNANFRPAQWLGEPSINWGNAKKAARKNKLVRDLNVMLCVLKTAYALGFRAVYLIGCDFTMRPEQCYSFATSKTEGQAASNNAKYGRLAMMLAMLQPHFDAAGFHVFNCNPKSGLTIFPVCSYQEAIEAASGHVPQDPLDTMDWYLK